jgi:NTE family protein
MICTKLIQAVFCAAVFVLVNSVEAQSSVPRTLLDPDRNHLAEVWLPEAFIGLAMSGGGSRAANFAAAALQNLDALGLLDHVTAISSVSGSSISAAYFGLHGGRLRDENSWDQLKALLRDDYAGDRVSLALRSVLLGVNKTEVVRDRLDRALYAGATFADLGEPGVRRPLIFLNATHFGQNRRFVFTEELVESATQADRGKPRQTLAHLPIATAVMASTAFPGLLDPVSLRAQRGLVETYTHLYDGGVADNLGVDTAVAAARNHYASLLKRTGAEPKACVILVIDGGREASEIGEKVARTYESALRSGFMERLISPTAWDAIDALVDRRSAATVEGIGIDGPTDAVQRGVNRLAPSIAFDLDRVEGMERATSEIVPVFRPVGSFSLFPTAQSFEIAAHERAAPGFAPPAFRCHSWYISPRQLMSVDNVGADQEFRKYGRLSGPRLYRRMLKRFFSQVETDLMLRGSSQCDSAFIQQRLFDVASILVQEDAFARQFVCETLKPVLDSDGFARCVSPPNAKLEDRGLPWQMTAEARSGLLWEVQCKAPAV